MDLVPMLTPVQHLGEYIREQRTAAQISLRSLATKAGVSNPYLSQVERGLRRPSAGVLAQIAKGLSISTETLLVKAGILSASGVGPVVDAIRADPHLDEHHKSVLIDVYAAFRREWADRQDSSGPDPARIPSEPTRSPSPSTVDRRAAPLDGRTAPLDGRTGHDPAEPPAVTPDHDSEPRMRHPAT